MKVLLKDNYIYCGVQHYRQETYKMYNFYFYFIKKFFT